MVNVGNKAYGSTYDFIRGNYESFPITLKIWQIYQNITHALHYFEIMLVHGAAATSSKQML